MKNNALLIGNLSFITFCFDLLSFVSTLHETKLEVDNTIIAWFVCSHAREKTFEG